jgi:hypothetical protein
MPETGVKMPRRSEKMLNHVLEKAKIRQTIFSTFFAPAGSRGFFGFFNFSFSPTAFLQLCGPFPWLGLLSIDRTIHQPVRMIPG